MTATEPNLIKLSQPISIESQLTHVGDAPMSLPEHYLNFAKDLVSRHGSIRVAKEEKGVHFYIACPDCLDEHGTSELYKKHLAINVDAYFGQGNDFAAMCMKHGRAFRITELTAWPPLEDRGIEYKPDAVPVQAGPNVDLLEPDEKGNLVPKNPGRVIPVNQLPDSHPARIYLASRDFDADELWRQFGCSYCDKENPNIYYRALPGGFCQTSQGRLIFFAYQFGIRVAWQARILEMEEGDDKFFFHPYKKEWVRVLHRPNKDTKWHPISGYESWDAAKFWTAPGTRRNQVLMGYDAAVAYWSKETSKNNRWVAVAEGPFDAGRIGPPAIPLLGKSMSAEQARLLEDKFGRVIIVKDNDEAGEKSESKIRMALSTRDVKFEFMTLPKRFKDLGEVSSAEAPFVHAMIQRLACSL